MTTEMLNVYCDHWRIPRIILGDEDVKILAEYPGCKNFRLPIIIDDDDKIFYVVGLFFGYSPDVRTQGVPLFAFTNLDDGLNKLYKVTVTGDHNVCYRVTKGIFGTKSDGTKYVSYTSYYPAYEVSIHTLSDGSLYKRLIEKRYGQGYHDEEIRWPLQTKDEHDTIVTNYKKDIIMARNKIKDSILKSLNIAMKKYD